MNCQPIGGVAALLALVLVSGCATAPDDGAERARSTLQQQGLAVPDTAPAARGQLTRQQAVQAALYYHPSLQAEYARLDIAAADVARAGELLNPSLSLSWLDVSGGGSEFSIGLSQSLAGVMLRPARQRRAAAEHDLAVQTLAEALRHRALKTESAWYALVTANQALQVQDAITRTAVLADQLAERFDQAGNMTPLERARHARVAAAAQLDLLAARQRRDQAWADLALEMALPHQRWRVGAPLMTPPAPLDDDTLMALLPEHPALQQQQTRQQQLYELAGERRRGRWLDDSQVGIKHERSSDERATGPTLAFRIPLWHRSRGEQQALLARQRLLEAETAALEQRLSVSLQRQLDTLQQQQQRISLHQQALLPALAAEVDARQERVNFMLDGVFNLLDSKRAELNGWLSLVEALGHYWQQEVQLAELIGSTASRAGGEPLDIPLQRGDGGHHHHHQPASDTTVTDDAHGGHH
jgi:outer membrane protein, heavy metal efflux system